MERISNTNNGIQPPLNSPLLKTLSSSYCVVCGVFYSASNCLFATQSEKTDPHINSLRIDFLLKEAKVHCSLFSCLWRRVLLQTNSTNYFLVFACTVNSTKWALCTDDWHLCFDRNRFWSRGTAYLAQTIGSTFLSVSMPLILQFLVTKTQRFPSDLHDWYESLEKSGDPFLDEPKN